MKVKGQIATASGRGRAPAEAPIFIIGVDRSGTTLLSLMLDSHSRIAIPYESHFFVKYYESAADHGDLINENARRALVDRILSERYVMRWDYRPSPAEINYENCETVPAAIDEVYRAYARHFGKDIWGDKTPSYISSIHILNQMFPDGRFIHIVRDGRDVALSLMKQWWGPADFVTAIEYWSRNVDIGRKMLAMMPPDRSIELRFEDLVRSPEIELGRVTGFLGVSFEQSMASDYSSRAACKVGARIQQHHGNLRGLPSDSQVEKWRRSLGAADQAIAFEIAGALLMELGYPSGIRRHRLRLARKIYHRLYEAYAWRLGRRKRRE